MGISVYESSIIDCETIKTSVTAAGVGQFLIASTFVGLFSVPSSEAICHK